jgi:isovaleryl-CoA dehydrogenase
MTHLATLNFSLGEDIDMLRDTINRFAAAGIAPRAAAIDDENLFRTISGASSEISVCWD